MNLTRNQPKQGPLEGEFPTGSRSGARICVHLCPSVVFLLRHRHGLEQPLAHAGSGRPTYRHPV